MIRSSLTRACAAATILLALSAGSALAHTQSVTPNGNGTGAETRGISNPWAMAHCQAAAPLIIADRSGGVVQFNPARPFANCVPGTRGEGH